MLCFFSTGTNEGCTRVVSRHRNSHTGFKKKPFCEKWEERKGRGRKANWEMKIFGEHVKKWKKRDFVFT